MPARSYVGLALLVVWSIWLLLFILSATDAKFVGLSFLAVEILLSLIHRALGWLMFLISRASYMDRLSWGRSGQRGAQAWYLGLGLVLIGIGCLYLIRSII